MPTLRRSGVWPAFLRPTSEMLKSLVSWPSAGVSKLTLCETTREVQQSLGSSEIAPAAHFCGYPNASWSLRKQSERCATSVTSLSSCPVAKFHYNFRAVSRVSF